MSEASRPAIEYEAFQVETGGQDVLVTWFPPRDVPEGQRHGSGGICLTGNGEVVLATHDGETWGFPAGRPEGSESWEETLRREMREETCVEVREAKLLGFSRGECIRGHEKGLVLVRSIWLAKVELNEWVPEHETHLTPWLAQLFVFPAYRHQGIGSLLVDAAISEARRLSHSAIYLYTSGSLPKYYEGLGWSRLDEVEYLDKLRVIMAYNLEIAV